MGTQPGRLAIAHRDGAPQDALRAALPDLTAEDVATVPPSLQADVESAATAIRTAPLSFAAGLVGLLLSGTGVVFSACQTLNHVAAVPYRLRAASVSLCLRVLIALILILAGAVTVGGLTVVMAAFPGVPQTSAALGLSLPASHRAVIV